MGYEAKILADSLSPEGVRLTTLAVTYPHAIHKDIMTHRMFSRNFQSFRAFPPEKVIENIKTDPFIPEFASRVKGMGQGKTLEEAGLDHEYLRAIGTWQRHIAHSIKTAEDFIELDMAKAQVNFALQDLTWITGIITSTEWDNFWGLRTAIDPETGQPFARPEVYKIASMMRDAFRLTVPTKLDYGEWHLPLVRSEEMYPTDPNWDKWKKVSVGRCARVSYLTHDGVRDTDKDIELHDRLMGNGHLSPFEHVARPLESPEDNSCPCYVPIGWSGNYCGWHQYRKDIPYEANYTEVLENVGL